MILLPVALVCSLWKIHLKLLKRFIGKFFVNVFTQVLHLRLYLFVHNSVLKPGGTLALCVWEHKGTNPIVKQMMARVIKGSSNAYYPHTDSVKPHEFEKMIEKSGLKCIDIEHGEFPFNLSDIDSHSPTSAFDLVSLPIKKELASLMTSGERPYAFEDAKAAFDEAVSKGLVRRTNHGYYVDDNRFTIIIARRAYEDTDKAKRIFKKHAKANVTSHFSQSPPSNNTSLVQVKGLDNSHDPIRKFDDLLSDSFTGKHSHYSPMSAFENAVKHTIVAEGMFQRFLYFSCTWNKTKSN